jgi:glycosyltransferase involved in cell wall biosynthesis
MVTDGQNGFLTAGERDVAAGLRELIDSPALRSRMGRASRAAAARFALEHGDAAFRRFVRTVEAESGAVDPVRVTRTSGRSGRPRRRRSGST